MFLNVQNLDKKNPKSGSNDYSLRFDCCAENCPTKTPKSVCQDCPGPKYFCQMHAGNHLSIEGHQLEILSNEKIRNLNFEIIKQKIRLQKLLILSQTKKLIKQIQAASKNALSMLKNSNKMIISIHEFCEIFISENDISRIVDSAKYIFSKHYKIVYDDQVTFNPVGIALDKAAAITQLTQKSNLQVNSSGIDLITNSFDKR